jgi:hypothetical protein
MAKTEKAASVPENASPPVQAPPAPRPPAGFNNEGRPDIDGWLKAAEGLVVHGKICGYFSFIQRNRDGSSKVREVICVTLLQPCVAGKEGGQTVQLEKGQVLAMSMMYALEPLKVYIEHRGEIWVMFKSTAPLGGGQKVWKADVFGKGAKAAAPIITTPSATPTNAPVDESEPWDN